MSLLDDLRMYPRLAWRLISFLRNPITLEGAKDTIRRLLEERKDNFLRLLKRAVFDNPKSPYLPLLELAGCEFGDIELMVKRNGLLNTLKALREAGVYVTYEEFKGRHPIVRNGKVFQPKYNDFDNPLYKPDYYSQSGGSTGAGTQVRNGFDLVADISAHELVTSHAHGVLDVPIGLWRGILPDNSGIGNVLRAARFGRYAKKWFSPVGLYEVNSFLLKYHLTTLLMVTLGWAAGKPLPFPRKAGLNQPDLVLDWIYKTLKTEGACLVYAPASRALRVCVRAWERGIDLTGATFRIAGEPITPAKVRGITRAGAKIITTYGFAEIGRIGMGCANPIEANDLHLCEGMCALLQYPRIVPGTDITVQAFNFTSLHPSAFKILLNAECDDYGVVERRSCGCPLEELGLTTHLREISSFQKLTGEGMTLVGSDMIEILEEKLPSRFGGSPLDYQLMEEEDENGFTRISLLVSPGVKIESENEVINFVYNSLENSSDMADTTQAVWKQAGTLRVKRMEPIWTGRGKLMSLYVAKRYRQG